jgi:FkbM family methyltransferase
VLDCGCFLGETAVQFAVDTAPSGRVFAFDPSPQHIEMARENAALNGLEGRVSFTCGGVSESTSAGTTPPPSENLNPGRPLAEDEARTSIDDFRASAEIGSVNFIKMDIEGSEAAALEGAHKTISECRPKLAICLYHKPSDLWTIPAEIKGKYPFYDLYLDHHSLHGEETVMYAVPL